MPLGLEITLAPESLDEGPPEERACFGLFTVRADAVELTGGLDFFISAYRPGPLVSGYHAAEWLAWNWWRLRFEPRSAAPEWWRAHKMTAIGEGYVWPNLTIFSDGVRTALLAAPSTRPDAKPFRYLGAHPYILPSTEFEAAVDIYIPRILARLHDHAVHETALVAIWDDVLADRADTIRSRRRKLEALLGRNPDEIEDNVVDHLIADTAALGEHAVEELAANQVHKGERLNAATLGRLAERFGHDTSPRDSVRLGRSTRLQSGAEIPAWQLGAKAARALRAQEQLGTEPLSDARLAALAGTSPTALSQDGINRAVSFVLAQNSAQARVVLRSPRPSGRRFELARLLAERIVASPINKLHVATQASTYRQKMQRSFAAELLSPFEAVDAMLEGDYSMEAQADVAAHFQVSERTILTLLVNHKRVEREELDEDVGAAS